MFGDQFINSKTGNNREAQSSDLPAIINLASQLGYNLNNGDISQRIEQISVDTSQKLFVCEYQGTVVGWLHICGLKRLLSEPFAEIVGFIVDKEFRSRGLGSGLLSYAEEWAKLQGYHLIRIRSNVNRKNTSPYYEKRGYRLVKIQNVFVKTMD
jgi:GNAT superfamily N-acetyltransferase